MVDGWMDQANRLHSTLGKASIHIPISSVLAGRGREKGKKRGVEWMV